MCSKSQCNITDCIIILLNNFSLGFLDNCCMSRKFDLCYRHLTCPLLTAQFNSHLSSYYVYDAYHHTCAHPICFTFLIFPTTIKRLLDPSYFRKSTSFLAVFSKFQHIVTMSICSSIHCVHRLKSGLRRWTLIWLIPNDILLADQLVPQLIQV